MNDSITNTSRPKYFIKTYGCQMNSYDSEKMGAILQSKLGMEPAESILDSDFGIINTCAIREKAQEKVFSELGRWRVEVEKAKRTPVIAVAGCVASQEADAIITRMPFVHLVLGPQTIHRIADLYNTYQETKVRQVDVSFPEIEKFEALPARKKSPVSAYVSVMEGCNKYCSYCIVPYTRGEEISRPYQDVLSEVKNLTEQGAREIVLLGQNVNDYQGSIAGTETMADLALLIAAISKIPVVERIRFTTSHPFAFNQRLCNAFGEPMSKLCNHLHLPVQSGSNRILQAMKRDYTREAYLDIVKKLRIVSPDITLSTDIIVGFPGETEEDFQATLDLVQEVGFDHSFSFIYSARPGTPAAELNDPLPLTEKKARLARLQSLLLQSRDAISNTLLHQTLDVLVEDRSRTLEGGVMGRTQSNRPVHFQAPESTIGTVVQVLITRITSHSMQGRLQPHPEIEQNLHA